MRLERMLFRSLQGAGDDAVAQQEGDAQSALEGHHAEKTAAGGECVEER